MNEKFWILIRISLFWGVQFTIPQHWFRWWLGAKLATSHYPNQCWPDSHQQWCTEKLPCLVIGHSLTEAEWCIYVSENLLIIDTYNGLSSIQCHYLNKYWLVVIRTHRSNQFWKLIWKASLKKIHLKCLLQNSGQWVKVPFWTIWF